MGNVYVTSSQEDILQYVEENMIANFDWDKVRIAMVALNWTWHGETIPSIDRMKSTVRGLFKKAISATIKENCRQVWGTGGFVVTTGIDQESNNALLFTMRFEVATWEDFY